MVMVKEIKVICIIKINTIYKNNILMSLIKYSMSNKQ